MYEKIFVFKLSVCLCNACRAFETPIYCTKWWRKDDTLDVVKMLKRIALEQDIAVICDRILKIQNKKVVSSEVPKNRHIL
jgi:hypothetical protein